MRGEPEAEQQQMGKGRHELNETPCDESKKDGRTGDELDWTSWKEGRHCVGAQGRGRIRQLLLSHSSMREKTGKMRRLGEGNWKE